MSSKTLRELCEDVQRTVAAFEAAPDDDDHAEDVAMNTAFRAMDVRLELATCHGGKKIILHDLPADAIIAALDAAEAKGYARGLSDAIDRLHSDACGMRDPAREALNDVADDLGRTLGSLP